MTSWRVAFLKLKDPAGWVSPIWTIIPPGFTTLIACCLETSSPTVSKTKSKLLSLMSLWSGDTVFASTYFEHALSLFWFGSEIVRFVFPWILDKINAHNSPIAPPPWTSVLHSFNGFFDASTANNTAW